MINKESELTLEMPTTQMEEEQYWSDFFCKYDELTGVVVCPGFYLPSVKQPVFVSPGNANIRKLTKIKSNPINSGNKR